MGLQFYNIKKVVERKNISRVKNVIKSRPSVKSIKKKEKRLSAKNFAFLRSLNAI